MIRYNAYRGGPRPSYLQPGYVEPAPAVKPAASPPVLRVVPRKPVDGFRFWTTQDDATLLLCRAEGWSFGAIGRRLGRTKSASIARFHRLTGHLA